MIALSAIIINKNKWTNYQIQEVKHITEILEKKDVCSNDAEIKNYWIKKKPNRINVEYVSVGKIILLGRKPPKK